MLFSFLLFLTLQSFRRFTYRPLDPEPASSWLFLLLAFPYYNSLKTHSGDPLKSPINSFLPQSLIKELWLTLWMALTYIS